MSITNQQLAATCEALRNASAEFLDWIADNEGRIRQEKVGLLRDFRAMRMELGRLQRATDRPMCVGVFGPSQSGKSYLISALARKGQAPLMAVLGNEQMDFVAEINPPGNRESTGVVTRFTIHRSANEDLQRPVEMRLLSEIDIVKILCNAFFEDVDHAAEAVLTDDEVESLLAAAEAAAGDGPIDRLTGDDILDLGRYLTDSYAALPALRPMRHGFWERAAAVAPRLGIEQRSALLAPLWGRIAAFTDLYRTLCDALRQLNFATEARSGVKGALGRDEPSIIDVLTLKGLGNATNGGTLEVVGNTGRSAALPRCIVTALIAELRIVIAEKPWDFFEHTDLLDFPGARSRKKIKQSNLDDFLREEPARDALGGLETLFLRGKVAYLFQRYKDERELTSMLLCVGDGNQEVASLPDLIDGWVRDTHGDTPEQRNGVQPALFLVLTKFDREFETKAGDLSDYTNRWKGRINNSILSFLAQPHEWPRKWDENGCFRNTFWLRNPNVKATSLFEFNKEKAGADVWEEIDIRDDMKERIRRFKEGFVGSGDIACFFEEPQEAWEAAFQLNDGGISYLANRLKPLCNPMLKRQQIAGRLNRLRREMTERMSAFYIDNDPQRELERRRAAARRVAGHLRSCAVNQRFGRLLSALQITEVDLASIFVRLDTQSSERATFGSTVRSLTSGEDIWGNLSLPDDQKAPLDVKDDAAQFANDVLTEWFADMRDLMRNERLSSFIFMPPDSIGDLVQELIVGAYRHGLETRIADAVRKALAVRVAREDRIAYPVRLTSNLINRYVDFLGFAELPGEQRPRVGRKGEERPIFADPLPVNGYPDLGEIETAYDQEFCRDWVVAFLELVERNALHQDGVDIDIASNLRLGQCLRMLEPAA